MRSLSLFCALALLAFLVTQVSAVSDLTGDSTPTPGDEAASSTAPPLPTSPQTTPRSSIGVSTSVSPTPTTTSNNSPAPDATNENTNHNATTPPPSTTPPAPTNTTTPPPTPTPTPSPTPTPTPTPTTTPEPSESTKLAFSASTTAPTPQSSMETEKNDIYKNKNTNKKKDTKADKTDPVSNTSSKGSSGVMVVGLLIAVALAGAIVGLIFMVSRRNRQLAEELEPSHVCGTPFDELATPPRDDQYAWEPHSRRQYQHRNGATDVPL